MKKPTKVKRKSPRKITKYRCRTCNKDDTANRSDVKGHPNCKKQESDYRIANGFKNKIKKELKNGITPFYNDRIGQKFENPFKEEIKTFLITKTPKEMLLPWRQKFDSGFLLYF